MLTGTQVHEFENNRHIALMQDTQKSSAHKGSRAKMVNQYIIKDKQYFFLYQSYFLSISIPNDKKRVNMN